MNVNLIDQIIEVVLSLFTKNRPASEPVQTPVAPAPVVEAAPEVAPEPIDWSNPKSKITSRFSVEEACMLQSWGAMHVPSEEEKAAIISIAQGVGRAADFLESKLGHKVSINVHAFIRPEKANIPGSKWDQQDYNKYIYETQVWKDLTPEQKALKHVPSSPHRTGHAIDFHIVGYEGAAKCQEIRLILAPQLEALGLRMEKINGGWVHLDNLPVVHERWFLP